MVGERDSGAPSRWRVLQGAPADGSEAGPWRHDQPRSAHRTPRNWPAPLPPAPEGFWSGAQALLQGSEVQPALAPGHGLAVDHASQHRSRSGVWVFVVVRIVSMADPQRFSVAVPLPSERTARIQEAGRVAAMVDALPDAIHAGNLSVLVEQACLEAFFVHVRGLLEFLRVKEANSPLDFSAADILASWTPQIEQAQKKNLLGYWKIASSQLMHFSRSRVKQEAAPQGAVDTSREGLQTIADDVLMVWDQFAEQLNHPLAPLRSDFSLFKAT